MMATVTEEVGSPSRSDDNAEDGTKNKGVSSNDEAGGTDSETTKEEEGEDEAEIMVCSSLKLDHRLQRMLFQLEDEENADQAAAADAQSLSQNLVKFKDDLCGWVPDPSVQYRRPAAEKPAPRAGGRTGTKPDAASAPSRRLLNCRNQYGHSSQQTASNPDYEFKHYSNYRKYCEQYRRYNTCGGPLQKLTQSALGGRPRTIYYAGEATAEAGVEVVHSNAGRSSEEPFSRSGPGVGGQVLRRARVSEKPSTTSQPIISYSEISVNSPRYNLMSEQSQRKARALQYYPNGLEWAQHPDPSPGYSPQRSGASLGKHPAAGAQPPGQWNVEMNEQTLTVYTSKPPGSLPAPARPATPPKPHLPFFPSQQPLRQLHKARASLTPPGLNPANDPLSSGYALDRSLGHPAGYSTGISRNPVPHRDFYSQLMHAAHCLSLAAKSPKDFDFELPRWPTCTSHNENSKCTLNPPQYTSHLEKPPTGSPSTSSPYTRTMQVQMTGRAVTASPTSTHHSSGSTSRPCQQQHPLHQSAWKSSTHPLGNPTSATTETHYITIEAPTCSPFDVTRSAAKQARRAADEDAGASKAASYRVTLKEKAVVPDIKEKTSVDMVADANRPLAVCEVTWF
ncbi:uncharacterized protein LOC110976287 [Acanthaster planci]|uniref:Uncharacterized protein LOC110976287 n=1 Tax=Acanthaster planci TaxID=133434 RepID=A0A8B7XW65_ACAPL|nr:uncharacterized protein LOC110976287 [Acanthaster planci]